jgi:hypothetical protein
VLGAAIGAGCAVVAIVVAVTYLRRHRRSPGPASLVRRAGAGSLRHPDSSAVQLLSVTTSGRGSGVGHPYGGGAVAAGALGRDATHSRTLPVPPDAAVMMRGPDDGSGASGRGRRAHHRGSLREGGAGPASVTGSVSHKGWAVAGPEAGQRHLPVGPALALDPAGALHHALGGGGSAGAGAGQEPRSRGRAGRSLKGQRPCKGKGGLKGKGRGGRPSKAEGGPRASTEGVDTASGQLEAHACGQRHGVFTVTDGDIRVATVPAASSSGQGRRHR